MRVAAPATWTTARVCERRCPEPGEGADRAFVTDRRGLDGIALPHHGQERDDAIMREIDLIDGIALFLQDRALFEHDVLQVRSEQCQIRRGEARQQQVAPAGMGAIQLHVCPLMAELDTASKCTALRPRARSRRRHWYATSMELVCAVSDKDAADGRLEQILSPQRLNRRRKFTCPFQCAGCEKFRYHRCCSTDRKASVTADRFTRDQIAGPASAVGTTIEASGQLARDQDARSAPRAIQQHEGATQDASQDDGASTGRVRVARSPSDACRPSGLAHWR